MGLWSDLDAQMGLTDDISNHIQYGKPKKKKKKSSKKIPSSPPALPVDTGALEQYEFTSVDNPDMSVAQPVDLEPDGMSMAPEPPPTNVDRVVQDLVSKGAITYFS